MSAARAVRPQTGSDGPTAAPTVVRLVPAPAAEPPAEGPDWHGPHGRPTRPETPYVQGALAVDFRQAAQDSFFGPQATGTADLPPAELWARKLIQATLEVCDGTRSADQLTRWLAPDVRERVARRGVLARRRARRPHRAEHTGRYRRLRRPPTWLDSRLPAAATSAAGRVTGRP